MKAQIALVTVLTDDFPRLKRFYQDVIGFTIQSEADGYVEFASEGVRFSICTRKTMADITGGHESFSTKLQGQAFELAFPCDSAEDVERTYADIITKGATAIKAPTTMPWGQTTAFFADPEGNIHEIFAD